MEYNISLIITVFVILAGLMQTSTAMPRGFKRGLKVQQDKSSSTQDLESAVHQLHNKVKEHSSSSYPEIIPNKIHHYPKRSKRFCKYDMLPLSRVNV